MKTEEEAMKSTRRNWAGLAFVAIAATCMWGCLSSGAAHGASKSHANASKDTESGYTDVFPYADTEMVDQGETPYYILKPGFQAIFEGPEDGEHVVLSISVLDETKKILVPEFGWVTTRIIEEKEWADGIPKETSRTFFAIVA